MTVSNNTAFNQIVADGTVGPFTFTFEIPTDADLDVYVGEALQTLTTQYTISGAGNENGGTVTFTTGNAPSNGAIVTFRRSVERSRATGFNNNGPLDSDDFNTELDRVYFILQEQTEALGRAMLRSDTSTSTASLTLPDPAADNVIGWNTDANALENKGAITDINTLAAIADDISAVAEIDSNVTTVAGNTSNITTVAGISGNVTTVAGVASSVPTVAGISSAVSTVAGINSAVSTVSGISSAVSTVSGISADVSTVASIDTEVTTVAGDSADIQTVAANIGSITAKMNTDMSNYDGSAIADFTSTGIDDNAASTVLTIDASGDAAFTGNVSATVFDGEATSAQYADLAEMYEASEPLAAGTVVRFGGSKEIEPTTQQFDTRVFGVVSTKPGFLLNAGRTGNWYPVALSGRCPVKVIGPVNKFDLLVPSTTPGHAQAAPEGMKQYAIGRALEAKTDAEAGTIEARILAH